MRASLATLLLGLAAGSALLALTTLPLVDAAAAAPKIQIDGFIESLCPDCQDFILSELFPAFTDPGVQLMMNLTLWPYGNANEKKDADGSWSFLCQHGTSECYFNMIETCAIFLVDHNSNLYVPFVHCLEKNIRVGRTGSAVATCAPLLGSSVSAQDLLTCAKSSVGNAWQHDIAVVTASLNPPHKYVPWLLVDGVHDTDAENEILSGGLVDLLCSRYTGSKPSVCSQQRRP